jgi:hypothetical protein
MTPPAPAAGESTTFSSCHPDREKPLKRRGEHDYRVQAHDGQGHSGRRRTRERLHRGHRVRHRVRQEVLRQALQRIADGTPTSPRRLSRDSRHDKPH